MVDTETARFAGGTELELELAGLLWADIFGYALCKVRGLKELSGNFPLTARYFKLCVISCNLIYGIWQDF